MIFGQPDNTMPIRNIDSLKIALNYGVELGMSHADVLKGSGVSQDKLFTPEQTIEDSQELRVLQNIVKWSGQPKLVGIELSKRYPLTCYGTFGYGILISPTLRSALNFGFRFLDLSYVFSQFTFLVKEKQFSVTAQTNIDDDVAEAVIYRDFFAMISIFAELYPNKALYIDIHLKTKRFTPEEQEAFTHYMQMIKGSIYHSSTADMIKGSTEIIDLPLQKGDKANIKACENLCLHLLEKKRNLPTVSDKVKECLMNDGLSTSMEKVAKSLNMTPRTLYRKLDKEGESWRALKNIVMTDLAEELLAQSVSIKEVALRLGYSDPSNFSHSFKRIKGYPPTHRK